jgi:BNR/Asp-box repeat.
MAYAFYVKPRGGDMISIEQRWTRSDTVDRAYIRRSRDHGRTWTAPSEMQTGIQTAAGCSENIHAASSSTAAAGASNSGSRVCCPPMIPWKACETGTSITVVSTDGGRTFGPPVQIIHAGAEFDSHHPLPGVWTGKNCVMLGDMTCAPVNAPDGRILLPVQISPLTADGKLDNPGGGYTYLDSAVLHGRWNGGGFVWEMSDMIRGDPARSTRGMDEGTLEFLEDGRLLMVLRGSNDRHPELPSYRWFSLSSDGGRRWTDPQPWTYDDGRPFFSPSACSQLVRHSSGRLFWFGNITPENPRGNRPRYPFVIGEVDRGTGLLLRRSVRTMDTLRDGEDPVLSLSNFFAAEDRRSHELVVYMTRLFARPSAWSGDAGRYRVPVPAS